MKMHILTWHSWLIAGVAGVAAMAIGKASAQQPVALADVMRTTGDTITIHADPIDEILVWPAGELKLDGKALDVSAGTIRFEGDVVIWSWAESDYPALVPGTAGKGEDGSGIIGETGEYIEVRILGPKIRIPVVSRNGRPGHIGETGQQGVAGYDAGQVRLDFQIMDGPGTLTVMNNGGRGGQGQQGGKGGTGATGGNGRNRGGNIVCSDAVSPQNGGQGGTGGPGGLGGIGGPGGSAGTILYARSLQTFIDEGRIRLSATVGAGGPGRRRRRWQRG